MVEADYMFTLKDAALNNFIDDSTIALPRYQRKLTWGAKQNFEFCLSIFKDFPLGVIVINIESDEKGKFKKWLLDGRQRRNVLTRMQNPEEIYGWAKLCIGFKAKDSMEEIRDTFWNEVDEFLEPEDDTKELDGIGENNCLSEPPKIQETELEDNEEIEQNDNNDVEFKFDESEIVGNSEKKFVRGDLNRLLDLILMVHPLRGKKSGFTRNFDFSKYLDDLDFVGIDGSIDTEELLLWIGYKKDRAEKAGKYPPDQNEFLNWLKQGTRLKKRSDQALINEISRRWAAIERILNTLDGLSLQLNEGRIGYLLLDNSDNRDAQKIFELINSSGTKLEAVEILSAKPTWNVKVEKVSDEVSDGIKKLYDHLGVTQQDIVKWDIAATSIKRINFDYII